MTKTPPNPRLLSGREVAHYLGYSSHSHSTLEKLRSIGLLPTKIPGTQRYDRVVIDRNLDRISGLIPTSSDVSE